MTAGDALIVLSLLSLIFAIVYPRVARLASEQRADAAVQDVEILRATARRHVEERGSWPSEAPPGIIPAELVGDLPDGFTFAGEHYTVDWNLWETVRAPEVIPEEDLPEEDVDLDIGPPADLDMETALRSVATVHPVAGITIHSRDESLLAMLLERYGTARSFAWDGHWTLILEDAG